MRKLIFFFLLPLSAFSQIADSSIRRVPLQGTINFRDLGGYVTADGHHVKWHVLYRSADISKLTPADLDTLNARRIVYDVDLRGVQESAKAPDKLNPGTDYILCPAGSDSVNAAMFRHLAGMTAGGDSLMLVWYRNTTYLAPRYRPFFAKLIVVPSGDALVFHCTAGKDRTGIAAALVLYALGVPYETIRQDYEATNYYRASDKDNLKSSMAAMHIGEPVLRALMSANGEYLDATFAAIRSQYGSVDHYLAEELGVDQQAIVTLRAKYLE
ncbi:MAG TPA: tyrosine-protein phosphatase [Puia sp.]|nr:tyrosine-protein phosphatase [Puia sp.]